MTGVERHPGVKWGRRRPAAGRVERDGHSHFRG